TVSRALVDVATRSLGAAAEDTTIAQYRALVVLASRGPQRLVDLAGALDVTPSTAGRMCDRLLRKGLIRRHRARADRRAVQVSVTAAGRQVGDQATARRTVAGAVPGRRGGTTGTDGAAAGPPPGKRPRPATAAGWARGSRAGLFVIAVLVGAGRRVRAGRGGVPVPDLLLHLAGHRARPVRPGRLRGQLASAVAGAGVLRGDPGNRRPGLRAADLPVRPGGPRARRPRGDDRGRGERRPDPPAGRRGQGGGLGGLHRGTGRSAGRARSCRSAPRWPPAWASGGRCRRTGCRSW